MNFILSYFKNRKGLIAFILITKFTAAMFELLIPYVFEYMIDEVAPKKSLRLAVLWGLIMLLLALFCRYLNITANRKTTKLATESAYEMRRDLFAASINLSGNDMDFFGLPSLTGRMTSDTYNVQGFIRALFATGIRAPALIIGGILVTFSMDTGLAAILAVIAPLAILSILIVSRKGIPLFLMVQESLDSVIRILRENITGIRVVKALSKEDYEKERFNAFNDDLTRKERRAGIIMASPGPIMTFFLNIGLTLVVLIGARRVNSGLTKPGVILAFLTYFNMILTGTLGLNRILMALSKANASANRIAEVVALDDGLPLISPENAAIPTGEGYIRFENVSFAYGNDSKNSSDVPGFCRENSLTNISFSMEKGSSLGIIGPTGSGKTSIINLLMRFYDPTEGAVFIDGKDVRTLDRKSLRGKFGAVFQNDIVFAGTMEENIDFHRNLPPEDLYSGSVSAFADEFISSYEDGYKHKSEMRGSNLSGGQRQRIMIARALAGHSDIIVLDDSSSALDYRTDAGVRNAIFSGYSPNALIVIAQRVSSVMNMDKIMCIDDGRIIGLGTHSELMENCPAYREIYNVQMGEE
ncbi:MAG: ABC transporter ATP-binding protein/permease [Oscillospiraceae bacterium]|nr:ABC transporter ATP-binding protein/permease [Oscillospiraceae bacterium]